MGKNVRSRRQTSFFLSGQIAASGGTAYKKRRPRIRVLEFVRNSAYKKDFSQKRRAFGRTFPRPGSPGPGENVVAVV